MATFSDLFDWLNQGAQGDIPGTGPGDQSVKQPPPSGAAQMPDITGPSPTQYPTVPQPQPQNIAAQQSAQRPSKITVDSDTLPNFSGVTRLLDQYHAAVTPQDYASDIRSSAMPYYNALVQMGLPPAVAKSIATQPTTDEGELNLQQILNPWPYSYRGQEQEHQASKDQPLEDHMWDVFHSRQDNLPREEGSTSGGTAGLLRLPSGQYVPTPRQQAGFTGWDEHNQTLDDTSLNRMLSDPQFLSLLIGSQ